MIGNVILRLIVWIKAVMALTGNTVTNTLQCYRSFRVFPEFASTDKFVLRKILQELLCFQERIMLISSFKGYYCILKHNIWTKPLFSSFLQIVILHTIMSAYKYRKSKMPANLIANYMLIFNLAIADFLMGIYLLALGAAGLNMQVTHYAGG